MNRNANKRAPLLQRARHASVIVGLALMMTLMSATSAQATAAADPTAPLRNIVKAIFRPDFNWLVALPWLVSVASILGGIIVLAWGFFAGKASFAQMRASDDVTMAAAAKVAFANANQGALKMVLVTASLSTAVAIIASIFA